MSSAPTLDGHDRPSFPAIRTERSLTSLEPRSGAKAKVSPRATAQEATLRVTEEASSEWTDAKASAQARRAAQARKGSGRRRLVDPATCERDYSGDELEFMRAMQDYKQRSGRMFPTWSEVLEVLQGLGYSKVSDSVEPSAAGVDGLSGKEV